METPITDWEALSDDIQRDIEPGERDWDQYRRWLDEKYSTLDALRKRMAEKKGYDESRLKAMEKHMLKTGPTPPLMNVPVDSESLPASDAASWWVAQPALWAPYGSALTAFRIPILRKLDEMNAEQLDERAAEQLLEQLA